MEHKTTVLVIDDELPIRRLVGRTLEAGGYKVQFADTAAEGLRQAAMDRPDLIILDLGLPDKDGLDVLKEFRSWSQIPVLVLSVRSDEEDIVSCLHAGADDYLIKPFRAGELLARISTAFRHQPAGHAGSAFSTGAISVDLAARTVTKSGNPVKLTPLEFKLLALFVRNAGKVLTHKYILENVWGPSFAEESEYTRVYVGQLRKKLEADPARPTILQTESGIGYRLVIV